ncbi:hypothetical protein ABIB73_007138 [Bradyrhizobium sp. F1.4.3]|uniref:hypothetical protein n=1 Tax=Bradyrhizobium sp. F1.4.3 TaxID=3156356 RepID=UPI0033945C91
MNHTNAAADRANHHRRSIRATSPQLLALPDGQNTQTAGQSASSKIFHFTEIRNCVYFASLRPKEEGRIAIVTNAGRAAVDVGHIGAKDFAGQATVSGDLAHTTGVIGVRQNRVVLAPGVCAPSLAVMWVAQPGARISHLQGDGGNSASLPGESAT